MLDGIKKEVHNPASLKLKNKERAAKVVWE